MSEQKQVIVDPSDLRRYRTELPNLYDDSDLDVYEYRLLGHYKRVGKCTEGLETTAKKCNISEGKVSEIRQTLAEKGFIKLERVSMDAGRYRFIVHVIDRWIENFARYSGLSVEEIVEELKKGSSSPREASPSPREASPSPHEGKKELVKKLIDKRFAEVVKKLSELTGGALNSSSADLISTWLEKHTNEWIIKAIEIADGKGARSANYVDTVLINWEAKGYPKSREEKVQSAKSTKKQNITSRPEITPADLERKKQIAIERMRAGKKIGAST